MDSGIDTDAGLSFCTVIYKHVRIKAVWMTVRAFTARWPQASLGVLLRAAEERPNKIFSVVQKMPFSFVGAPPASPF